jgi:hypothetical protein
MQDDFSKYEAMKKSGASPQEVYCVALKDGVDSITMFRLIRSVFSMDFVEAKEAILKAEGWASLKQYQDAIADELERIDEGDEGQR